MNTQTPVSDHVKTRGIIYFARMVDKIQLHAAGRLPADFQGKLGFSDPTNFDARFCRFWEIDYERLRARVLQGGTNEDIFDEVRDRRPLNPEHVFVWNFFLFKRGWRDSGAPSLAEDKAAAGLACRDDVQTFVDLHDAEEGRTPRPVFE